MPKDRKAASGKTESGSAARKSRATSKRATSKTSSAKKTTAAKKVVAKKAPAKKSAVAKKIAPAKTAPVNPPAKKKSAPAKTAAAKKSAASPRKSGRKIEIVPLDLPVESTAPMKSVDNGEERRSSAAKAEPHESAEIMEAFRADTTADAENGLPELESELSESEADTSEQNEFPSEPRPEAHLERLQKILSQAGIASRRHAEEMITTGRVMVNGQVVTQLGTKADPERDHIRVDNKLIQRAERHRTFILNKPKGYVTTVSDPEKRPTVMDFFSKTRERLYPVGRLDYLSEGLLLMTNDGELANLLTRASSGVEKTYLVKVAGQLTEEELDQLREGVSIEKGEPGSERVRSAPAQVRQIRPGDNPWYEVILIEGRNRELRKMFSSTGHFVEKIRRVGYGPLVLDVEPGQFRELTPEELNALRLTAEGKMKPRRPKSSAMLPKEAGLSAESRSTFRGKRREGFRPGGPNREGRPPRESRPFVRSDSRPSAPGARFEKPPFSPNRDSRTFDRPDRAGGPVRPSAGRPAAGRPIFDRSQAERPGFDRPRPDRPKFDRPKFERPGFDRPKFERAGTGKPAFDRPREDRGAKPFGERPQRFGDRPGGPRPVRFGERPAGGAGRPSGRPDRPGFAPRSGERRPFSSDKPRFDRGPSFGNRPPSDRPPRPFSDRAPRGETPGEGRPPRREFRPREEGAARPERPNRFGGPRFDRPQGARPAGPREGTGPRFGGAGKPSGRSSPGAGGRPRGPGGPRRPGGFSRPPGGPGRGGPGGRSSGPKPGGFRGRPGGGPRGGRG